MEGRSFQGMDREMNNKILIGIAGLLLGMAMAPHSSLADFPKLTGPYLGQTPPGMAPEIFAPGIISTCFQELNSVFSPDGQEFCFCVRTMGASSLFVMRCLQGVWGRPEPLPFAGPYNDIDVSLSPDGKYLFFTRQILPRITRSADKPLVYEDYLEMHNSPDNASTNIWWVDAKIINELKSRRIP